MRYGPGFIRGRAEKNMEVSVFSGTNDHNVRLAVVYYVGGDTAQQEAVKF